IRFLLIHTFAASRVCTHPPSLDFPHASNALRASGESPPYARRVSPLPNLRRCESHLPLHPDVSSLQDRRFDIAPSPRENWLAGPCTFALSLPPPVLSIPGRRIRTSCRERSSMRLMTGIPGCAGDLPPAARICDRRRAPHPDCPASRRHHPTRAAKVQTTDPFSAPLQSVRALHCICRP